MSKLLDTKIALITGASRGIGAAVAERYAEEGAHVLLVARTISDLEALDDRIQAKGGIATIIPLDLLEGDKIDALAAPLYERFGKLDILVGNAAMLGNLTPVAHYSPPVWQQVIDLNLTANWRLLRALDPLLKKSIAGRALFVTSDVTVHTPAYWGAYTASKAGLEALIKTYRAEIQKTNLAVHLIDPGDVLTSLYTQAFPGKNMEDITHPRNITQIFVDSAL